MAEDAEDMEAGADGRASSAAAAGTGINPAAASIALIGASRDKADAFLDKQSSIADKQRILIEKQSNLADLQAKELAHELKLRHWSLQLRHASSILKLAFEVSLALVAIALVCSIGAAMWNASQADGTVVDAFSVPPQLEQEGVTGEVVASDLIQRIGAIREDAQSLSLNVSQNVSRDSADDIKVEIPETGVSLSEAWRYLRIWLGHERHLSGNLRLIGDGQVRLTVTLDDGGTIAVSGGSGDLDKVEQQAAEQVFANVDPINYVLYLRGQGRMAEALIAAERAAQGAVGPVTRAEAYGLWSNTIQSTTGDMSLALARARTATNINPKLMAAYNDMTWALFQMGHDEEALHQVQLMRNFQEEDQPKNQRAGVFSTLVAQTAFMRDNLLGAFAQAASEGTSCRVCSTAMQLMFKAEYAARAHDGMASRALFGQAGGMEVGFLGAGYYYIGANIVRYFSDANVDDWPAAAADARAYEVDIKADPRTSPGLKAIRLRIMVAPLLAYALAHNGDHVGAQAVIATTPADCYDCIRMRGNISAVERNWGRADYWFARAVQQGPSIPFAYADWGQALLERGQPDAAIAKFNVANQKGPHFADPLEGWGEALMAKNRSDLALAKFEEANKYAPNWGRLHLKWGEALGYAGRKDEAQKQFAQAASLDLTLAEKAELAGMNHG